MAVVGYFPATLAVDSNTGTRLRNAEAQVYAMTDTSFSSPLAITDVAGVPITGNKLVSNSDGIYPEFKPPAGVTQVIVKSGQALTPMTDISVSAAAAETAAVNAATAAGTATSAASAASSSASSAATAAAAAAAVGATTDAQMTAIQASPTSTFAQAQKATIGAAVGPAVSDAVASSDTVKNAAAAAVSGAVTSADLVKGSDSRLPQPLPIASGYIWTLAEDENGNAALGVRVTGEVEIPRLLLGDDRVAPSNLTPAARDALGRELPIGTSGFVQTIAEDENGNAAIGIRPSGVVEIPKLAVPPAMKQEIITALTPVFDVTNWVVNVVGASGSRQLVALNLSTGKQYPLTSGGDNFAPVIAKTGKVVFARTGETTLLSVPVTGGVIAPAISVDDVAWWGDSLSAMGTPADFDALIPASVYNGGVGSQNARHILGRQGGVPIYVTLDGNQIPASGSVNVTMISPVDPAYNTGAGRKFTLNGVLGTLTPRTSPSDASGDITTGTQTFTRDASGDVVPVAPRTRIIPDLGVQYAARTAIFWVGRNSVYTDAEADAVAPALRQAIQYLTPAGARFLVLGVTGATNEAAGSDRYIRRTRINAQVVAMLTADGYADRWIDTHRYLVDNGLAALGATPTAEDAAAVAVDALPPTLMDPGDAIHFKAATRAVIAARTYTTAHEKGWY